MRTGPEPRSDDDRSPWEFRLRRLALRALRPLLFPVFRFTYRQYHTEQSMRLACIQAAVTRWQLGWAQEDGDTLEDFLNAIDGYSDWKQPTPYWELKRERTA